MADTTVTLNLSSTASLANPRILGTAVQWPQSGDSMLMATSSIFQGFATREEYFDPTKLALATGSGYTMLRYPGGVYSDTFRWTGSMGAFNQRVPIENYYTQAKQVADFGLAEFLALAKRMNAEAVFQVNPITASLQVRATESIQLVTQTNITRIQAYDGTYYPTISFWELGNEPYLSSSVRPDLNVGPSTFCTASNTMIAAMKLVDPNIKVGIPLNRDQSGAFPLATVQQGWNTTLIGGLTQDVDFVALHNSYWPLLWNPADTGSDASFYQTTMAAHKTIDNDFTATRIQLSGSAHAINAKFAVTEYNGLFTAQGTWTDGYNASLTAGMYVADVLRLFAYMSDMLFANHWSLSDNAMFGSFSGTNFRRPVYYVFNAYKTILTGSMIPVSASGPTYNSGIHGIVPAHSGTLNIGMLVTRANKLVQILLISRDPLANNNVVINSSGGEIITSFNGQIFGNDQRIFDAAEHVRSWTPTGITASVAGATSTGLSPGYTFPVTTLVPSHSLVWITLTLQ